MMLLVLCWVVGLVMELGIDYCWIEGLIVLGIFNIDLLVLVEIILVILISVGVVEYMKFGLVDIVKLLGLLFYDIFVVVLLVQQEVNIQDFLKVVWVIYNWLYEYCMLEFDLIVNYLLDCCEVVISDIDCVQCILWNIYMVQGLLVIVICLFGVDVLCVVEYLVFGDWLYFVIIDFQGMMLFIRDYQQYLVNIELVKYNGVFDSV